MGDWCPDPGSSWLPLYLLSEISLLVLGIPTVALICVQDLSHSTFSALSFSLSCFGCPENVPGQCQFHTVVFWSVVGGVSGLLPHALSWFHGSVFTPSWFKVKALDCEGHRLSYPIPSHPIHPLVLLFSPKWALRMTSSLWLAPAGSLSHQSCRPQSRLALGHLLQMQFYLKNRNCCQCDSGFSESLKDKHNSAEE